MNVMFHLINNGGFTIKCKGQEVAGRDIGLSGDQDAIEAFLKDLLAQIRYLSRAVS